MQSYSCLPKSMQLWLHHSTTSPNIIASMPTTLPINFENNETHRLAEELADLTGENPSKSREAVRDHEGEFRPAAGAAGAGLCGGSH
jgi:hypothetical protein